MRRKAFNHLYRLFELLASLELAIFIILVLAVVMATGTVYESKYGAAVASKEIYRSFWMQILLWLFLLNVAAAAMSRIPWRRHHIGFLVTHLGIIILLLGSWVTQRAGVDGTVALAPGESGRLTRIDENVLYVFRGLPGQAYRLALEEKLTLDARHPLREPRSFAFTDEAGAQEVKLLRYYPHSAREVKADPVPKGQGMPALRFQMSGSRATFSEWLFLQADVGATREVGPAVFRFVAEKPDLGVKPERATVVLYGAGARPPFMAVARANEAYRELGRLQPGKPVELGWMDFHFLLEEYHPSALPQATYQPIEAPAGGGEGLEVVEVGFAGQTLWLELGASGQIPLGDALYYFQYTKRQVDFGFELGLKEFRIDYYEGTTRPKEYSSLVEFGGRTQVISMNEPLYHNGYTFYQSSYEADDEGRPRYSVLSVNLDPGRGTKYLGSLMMVLGIILMFYFKPVYSGRSRWLKKSEEKDA